MVEVFNFIKVIFIAVILLIVFSYLAPTINDSVDNWKGQSWASEYPLITFLISGMNFWIFLGFVIGILGAIVYGTKVWSDSR